MVITNSQAPICNLVSGHSPYSHKWILRLPPPFEEEPHLPHQGFATGNHRLLLVCCCSGNSQMPGQSTEKQMESKWLVPLPGPCRVPRLGKERAYDIDWVCHHLRPFTGPDPLLLLLVPYSPHPEKLLYQPVEKLATYCSHSRSSWNRGPVPTGIGLSHGAKCQAPEV